MGLADPGITCSIKQLPYDLVHVPPGPDILIFFPELDGTLRIAFQVHVWRIALQSGQGEHLVHHLKDQYILPEGKSLGHPGFGQAEVSDLFDVHGCHVCLRI